ncbi:MAG: class I SAM-dependent methyltransferase [Phycisphaerae bacterium]
MSRHERIRDHYERRIDPVRKSYDVLDWASAQSQHCRFEVLASQINLDGATLLDIGCGLGDLWGFCKDRRIDVYYTGVDILPKMVEEARSRHPDGHFEVRNIFQPDPDETDRQFDVVFASGTFNLNLGNNLEFLAAALGRMQQLARKYVVFNLLHVRRKFEPERYFYSDPEQIAELLKPSGWDWRIVDDYLPNDFTVIVQRPQNPAG